MICEFGTKQDFKRSLIEEMSGPATDGKCPIWLIHRMELLKRMPPPSIEKVRAQFAASRNYPVDSWLMGDVIR